jgi:hypothetical protein
VLGDLLALDASVAEVLLEVDDFLGLVVVF